MGKELSSFCWTVKQTTPSRGRYRCCLNLSGVIDYAWQGPETSPYKPVLPLILSEVPLIPHMVKFSKYSAVKKSPLLCLAQLFSDVLGHRLLFAPMISTNIDLNWCFVGECNSLGGATLE